MQKPRRPILALGQCIQQAALLGHHRTLQPTIHRSPLDQKLVTSEPEKRPLVLNPDQRMTFILIKSTPIKVSALTGTKELGRSSGGKITIRKGLPPAEEFNTLAHEIAHETLHHSGERFPESVRETEAEAVAFVVCTAIGLEAREAAADYIGLYSGGAKLLRASLERVSTTARQIIAFIEQEPTRKAA